MECNFEKLELLLMAKSLRELAIIFAGSEGRTEQAEFERIKHLHSKVRMYIDKPEDLGPLHTQSEALKLKA